jgi:hypothetical protein
VFASSVGGNTIKLAKLEMLKSYPIITYVMSSKTILIIVGSFGIGVIVIGIAMMAGAGWETPGQYTGTHNAANKVTDSKNCYSFQTGCTNGNNGTTSSYVAKSGASLSGNYYNSP